MLQAIFWTVRLVFLSATTAKDHDCTNLASRFPARAADSAAADVTTAAAGASNSFTSASAFATADCSRVLPSSVVDGTGFTLPSLVSEHVTWAQCLDTLLLPFAVPLPPVGFSRLQRRMPTARPLKAGAAAVSATTPQVAVDSVDATAVEAVDALTEVKPMNNADTRNSLHLYAAVHKQVTAASNHSPSAGPSTGSAVDGSVSPLRLFMWQRSPASTPQFVEFPIHRSLRDSLAGAAVYDFPVVFVALPGAEASMFIHRVVPHAPLPAALSSPAALTGAAATGHPAVGPRGAQAGGKLGEVRVGKVVVCEE